MANCIACGVQVGCGCQLIKGRCPTCNQTYQQSLKGPIKPYTQDDKSKIS